MNTFAVLLLAYPFYLAVNGRLIAYTSLVNKAATPTPVGGTSNAVQNISTIPVG